MRRLYKACVADCSKSVGGGVVLRSRDNDLRGRGCLQVHEEVLMTICTCDQMEEISRNSLSLMRSATNGIAGGRLELTNKGKEKCHRSSNWWKSALEFADGFWLCGSRLGYLGRADMGPKIGEAEDCVILEGDDMSKVTQHFVKVTQHFVNVAVSIFDISAVGRMTQNLIAGDGFSDLNPLSSSKVGSSLGISPSLSDAKITTSPVSLSRRIDSVCRVHQIAVAATLISVVGSIRYNPGRIAPSDLMFLRSSFFPPVTLKNKLFGSSELFTDSESPFSFIKKSATRNSAVPATAGRLISGTISCVVSKEPTTTV
ncbi:hypothetical protein F2Q70_00027994 [Brassica cretica]|uniref:Uncharacterized protein n=1 Tax=Brassica cretica TaxID=69181 RepID=A0A8S9LJ30_BRACR|nr:hypothetical protein F2Q70_00027994 [Brassica cretica]